MFKKAVTPRLREQILKKAMNEIEKLLLELEKEGKDLATVKLKKFSKTHHIQCICPKCSKANKKKEPRLRGLREYGFKVFVNEQDEEIIEGP